MVSALTQRHRAQQLLLRRATQSQVDRLFAALDFNNLDATYPALAVAMARMVEQNRRTSSGIASSYVRNFRKASGIRGDLKIITAPSLVVDQFNASLHATSVAHLKAATARGVPEATAVTNALTETRGAMARLVLNAGRDTVTRTVSADSQSLGWQRVLGGGGCDFCQMLAGRGAVYSEETVDFDAHDHCGCSAEPVYREDQVNPPSDWRPAGTRDPAEFSADVDAGRTLDQLRETLAQLERSLEKFDSPGTRARVEELRRNIAKRT